jgi:ABC-type microcin C transport system permease subunit YejB
VVTLIGLQIGFLLGGAVVTETMFAWPGVGRMAVGAITSSDFPLAQGAILMLAVGFIAINLGVDVIYAYLDPRIGRACAPPPTPAWPACRRAARPSRCCCATPPPSLPAAS